MATDFEKNTFKANHLGLGGAAMRKMQELAQQLYDSTPGLQEDVPRNASKILANVKREDNRAEIRARTFLNGEQNSTGVGLRKGGTIEKKDLTIAMSAEDWETKYFQMLEKFSGEKSETVRLRQNMIKKQERYIDREHEYRKTIAQIEVQIQEKSTKPLEIIHEHDENQLLLSGIDPSEQKQQEMMEKERKQKIKNELQINQKNVKEIHSYYDRIMDTIGKIQEKTAKELEDQKDEIWKTLDKKLEDIKSQLKAETEKKRENQYDFKEKEKELNEHLETMTQIAQKIDDENRNLMKKNSELKIQYMSQENDRDLLLKQLIYQKKEHQRLRRVLEDSKKEADELTKGQENTLLNNVNYNDQSLRNQQDNSRTFTGGQNHTTSGIMNQRVQSGINNQKTFGRQSNTNKNQTNLTNIKGSLNMNNSRRNISLTGPNIYTSANGGRPKTAAMPGMTGALRPPTAAYNNIGKRLANNMTAGGVYGNNGFNFIGGTNPRAISANILINNPRIKRYEDIITRLKKMLTMEKKSLRMVRTLCSKEIEIKNQLEKILRMCVDDVKSEIAKKRSENKSIYHKVRRDSNQLDEKALTQQEREKIIEVLLSQERVLTLLYDKTFPPRPATAKVGLKNAFQNGTAGLHSQNNLRQFNYYGQLNNINEEDGDGLDNQDIDGLGVDQVDAMEVQKLEREIEEVLRNRISTADGLERGRYHNNDQANSIINISKGDNSMKMNVLGGQRQQSAATTANGGNKRNLMSAAYRHRQNINGANGGVYADETNEFADDIYEDEESSDGMD